MLGCGAPVDVPAEGVEWVDAEGRVRAVLEPERFRVDRELATSGEPGEGEWGEFPVETYLAVRSSRNEQGWTIVKRSANLPIALEFVGTDVLRVRPAFPEIADVVELRTR
jgi:hypothetical protein